MKRRIFLNKAAKASALLGCLPIIDQYAFVSNDFSSKNISSIDPLIMSDVLSLFKWMNKHGWNKYINERLKINIKIDKQVDLNELTKELSFDSESVWFSVPENLDFSGNKLIEKGVPSKSLLYHLLASPRVKSDLFSEYPTLYHLDSLENFIYSLVDFDQEIDEAHMMVLAYEYRPAYKVPPFNPAFRTGKEVAGIVYSRTGIARIGTKPMNFDYENRSFTNLPKEDKSKKDIAVTGARYGLFWVKIINGTSKIKVMDDSEDSETRRYIQPICKVYERSDRIIEFGEYHKIEKLKKLSEYRFDGKCIKFNKENFNFNLPPFTKISSTNDKGEAIGSEHNSFKEPFIELKRYGSSVLVLSIPCSLVQEVTFDGEIVSFKVEEYFKKFNQHTNRRYSALKLPNENGRENTNAIVSQAIFRKNRRTTGLRSPKIAPLFLNIKYEVQSNSEVRELNGKTEFNDNKVFEDYINQSYWAQLFQDSICDGCVTARVYNIKNQSFLPFKVTPAFSLVTAPDFFQFIDSLDLRAYYFKNSEHLDTDEDFYEGATINLSQIRLKGNIDIKDPYIIDPKDEDSVFSKKNDITGNTITAVISNVHKRDSPSIEGKDFELNFDRNYRATSFLPDTGTGVFFPGWDATYSGDKYNMYLATYGLGSPFPEDMKLCAAANGMWPVTSPDAGRTFQGSLEPILGKTPNTSIPLLDSEVGFNEQSPFVKDFNGQQSYGWDGEQGPFLQIVEGSDKIFVNYTDIGRADYIQNLLDATIGFDMSILRELETSEVINRMDCMRFCIKTIDHKKVWKTKLWLIAAEAVEDWSMDQELKCLPKKSIFDLIQFNRNQGTTKMNGKGYFFVFVSNDNSKSEYPSFVGKDKKRKLKGCEKVWLCQVTRNELAYLEIINSKISKKGWISESYSHK